MKQILEYILNRSTKIYTIKATNENIKMAVRKEIYRLGLDANLNHIDVRDVTNMEDVFACNVYAYGEGNFTKEYINLNPDVSKWNMSNVTNIAFMFHGCEKFNCDISQWDVKNVTNMKYTFWDCSSFNQNLSRWKVDNVKENYDIFGKCPIKEEYKPKFKK